MAHLQWYTTAHPQRTSWWRSHRANTIGAALWYVGPQEGVAALMGPLIKAHAFYEKAFLRIGWLFHRVRELEVNWVAVDGGSPQPLALGLRGGQG